MIFNSASGDSYILVITGTHALPDIYALLPVLAITYTYIASYVR